MRKRKGGYDNWSDLLMKDIRQQMLAFMEIEYETKMSILTDKMKKEVFYFLMFSLFFILLAWTISIVPMKVDCQLYWFMDFF